MAFFFADPQVERLPPDETRLLDLRAEPYPDGKRLRVSLDLTPFEKRPDIELTLTGLAGAEAAVASIVEPVAWTLELTLHVRRADPAGRYSLAASLAYPDLGEVDRRQIAVEIPLPTE